jgi:hypothetical protein
MNFCSYFPYSLTDLGEIRHRRCPHNVVEKLCVNVKPYCTHGRKWSFVLLSAVSCDVHRNWSSDFGFLEILRCGSRIVHR